MSGALQPDDLLYVVNSLFGARNNPGIRPWRVTQIQGVHPRVFARGSRVAYRPIAYPIPVRELLARGLNFLRIKLFPGLPARAIEQNLFDLTCLWRSRLLRKTPRYVHLWDHLPRTAAYWRQRGSHLIVDMHMAHPRCLAPLVEEELIDPKIIGYGPDEMADKALALAHTIVCPSEFVRDSLRVEDQSKAVVIPFGVSPAKLIESKPRTDNKVRVLMVGNINYRKGIPFLLEAWKRLDTSGAELILCGRLFAEARSWRVNLPDNVRFEGFQKDIRSYYREVDVFVLPSLMEGSSKAVYEAMSHGLPVIVTPNAGAVIEAGREGLIVPPADVSALVNALQDLLRDAELRAKMGEEGKKTVTSYRWEDYANKVAGLYQNSRDGSEP